MKRSHKSLPRDRKQTSVWKNNVSYSLPIPLQSSLHSTEFKTHYLINITWCTALASSYPSIFWLIGSFLPWIIVIHSFHCLITLCSCVPDDYSGRGLPTALFPDIASWRTFTTNSLCLIICTIQECRLFFKICKLHCLIETSMRLASLDTNVCLCKIQYLLVYILDTVLFLYYGLHSLTRSNTDAIRVWNCDFNTSPWETEDFTVCSVSMNTLRIATVPKLIFLKRPVFWMYATVDFPKNSIYNVLYFLNIANINY